MVSVKISQSEDMACSQRMSLNQLFFLASGGIELNLYLWGL